MPLNDTGADAYLRDILLSVKTIAMVGASDKETRPSYGVFTFLQAHGYHVIGVNPSLAGKKRSWHGILQDTGGYSRAGRYGGYFPQFGSRRGSRR